MKTGAALKQRNAYLVSPYPEEGGAEIVQDVRRRLLHPLALHAGELSQKIEARADAPLARSGEVERSPPGMRPWRSSAACGRRCARPGTIN